MEYGVFLREPVKPVLSEFFVEARLHTDGDVNALQISDLQTEYVGSESLPNYVVIDPKTLKAYGRYEGVALSGTEEKEFADFLKKAFDDIP